MYLLIILDKCRGEILILEKFGGRLLGSSATAHNLRKTIWSFKVKCSKEKEIRNVFVNFISLSRVTIKFNSQRTRLYDNLKY